MCWEKTTESRKVQGGGISSPRRGQIHVVKATHRRLKSIFNFKVQEKKIEIKSIKKEIEENLDSQEEKLLTCEILGNRNFQGERERKPMTC